MLLSAVLPACLALAAGTVGLGSSPVKPRELAASAASPLATTHGKPPQPRAPLQLKKIRALAAAADLIEIYFNPTSRVISFAPQSSEGHNPLTRLNVYYTTGT